MRLEWLDQDGGDRNPYVPVAEDSLGLPEWSSRARETWEEEAWMIWLAAASARPSAGGQT